MEKTLEAPDAAGVASSLGHAQAEQALRAGVRALQEREMLLRRLAAVAETTGDKAQAEAGRREADRVQEQAEQLSRLVEADLNCTTAPAADESE